MMSEDARDEGTASADREKLSVRDRQRAETLRANLMRRKTQARGRMELPATSPQKPPVNA